MYIKLIPGNTPLRDIRAAFLRGDSPEQWLKVIDQLNIDPSQLECYAIPQSIRSAMPAGLFTIFNTGAAKLPDMLAPYGMVGNKLFIPVNAELYPATTGEELQETLLYERNIFHPSIGLIGFDRGDRIALESLITWSKPTATTWDAAHPGNLSSPAFNQISRRIKSPEEFLTALRGDMSPESLDAIPKPGKTSNSPASRISDTVLGYLAKSLSSIIKSLRKNSDTASSTASTGRTSRATPTMMGTGNGRPGLLERLSNWLDARIASLEEKRNNEIERLLKMFRENPDEALRYAIPLGSNTPHRGKTDEPSSMLTPNSTDFNPGSFRGSSAADRWNVSYTQQQNLQAHYRDMAKREIKKKNFKKAAYIYAHLLNDFAEAARALELGEHYHEAATLYKDHLNNMIKAADCFERGGYLPEAIAIYTELKRYEKAGDLYRQLEQHDNATHSYGLAQQQALNNDDYIEASRITNQKLESADQSLDILLKGWTTSRQAEQCLRQYINETLRTQPDTLADRINTVYVHHTAPGKMKALLEVLQQAQNNSNPKAFTQASLNIVYRIVSNLAQQGDTNALRSLRTFLPDDRLIDTDYRRYITLLGRQAGPRTSAFRLDSSIKWIKAIRHHNQFVVLGIKEKSLHLARGNWNGYIEYTTWNGTVHPNDRFNFIAYPVRTNQIVLISSRPMNLEEKVLEKNTYFDEELRITIPPALSDGCLGMIFNVDGTITAVNNDNYRISLRHYASDFSSHTDMPCTSDDSAPFVMTQAGSLSEVFHRNFQYFTYTGSILFRIAESGSLQAFELNEPIWLSDISPPGAQARLVLVHEKGFFLYRQTHGAEATLDHVEFNGPVIPTEVRFIADDKFVVCGKQKIITYRIIDADVVEEIETEEIKTTVRAVWKGRYRNQYILLGENGELRIKTLR